MSRKAYPTDLKDAEWELLEPLLPKAKPGGRPRSVDLREILNALFYRERTGCAWEMLPHDLPPAKTVYDYFNKWSADGTWERINANLVRQVRQAAGRDPEPSAAIIDSQSVKTTEKGGERGFDAAKKVNGRKRHLLVDVLGLVLLVIVHAASVQEQEGAKRVFERIQGRHPRLRLVWADAGYKVQWLLDWVQTTCTWVLEIVSRPEGCKGFVLLPRRWVVERTFGWLSHYRVLSKDYEVLPRNSEAVVYVAMIHLMVRRLACQTTTTPP